MASDAELTVSRTWALADAPVLSVTTTVKEKDPGAVGVPENVPAPAPEGVSVAQAGGLPPPLLIDHVNGAVPPWAVNV
jgi:hypothetical protein